MVSAKPLYRALLREAARSFSRFGHSEISIRAPIPADLSVVGTYSPDEAWGMEYQLQCLEALVPGLAVQPQQQQLPLTLPSLQELIRSNFRQQRGAASSSSLDQGFAALRALPTLAYLEACSSSSSGSSGGSGDGGSGGSSKGDDGSGSDGGNGDGIIVDATSCFTGVDGQQELHWFIYRIRIINTRRHPVKVLGRGWVINNNRGELEGLVRLAADNGIVGQQPVIMPGTCWEYYSRAALKTDSGSMSGQLLLALLEPAGAAGTGTSGDSSNEDDGKQRQQEQHRGVAAAAAARVAVPVLPFRLQTRQAAVREQQGQQHEQQQQQT